MEKRKWKRVLAPLLLIVTLLLAGCGKTQNDVPEESENVNQGNVNQEITDHTEIVKLMVKEVPEESDSQERADYAVTIYGDGYESTMGGGLESGKYTYDRLTGVYTLDNDTTITENTRGYSYQDKEEKIRMIPYVAPRKVLAELSGVSGVSVPGGYTIDLTFTLEIYSDDTCLLSQSINDTAFSGTWEKAEDGSYVIEFEELEVADSRNENGQLIIAIEGEISGISFSVTVEGTEK